MVNGFLALSSRELFSFIFGLYDADNDGFIGSNDMLFMLQYEMECIQDDFMLLLRT